MANISIHLFDITSEGKRDMAALLGQIAKTTKLRRWRNVSGKEMALLESRHTSDSGLWLVDFVKRRQVGPGKLKADSELESFDFAHGEHFGEETAALIDVKRGWMATEYNQHGVRPPSMVEYFNVYSPDDIGDWQIAAKLDPKVEQRLAKKTSLRAAQMTVKLTDEVTSAMRQGDVSLGGALAKAGQEAKSAVMSINLTMSHSSGFLADNVMAMFRRLGAIDTGDVRQLKIRSRQGEFGEDEAFDLLEQRILVKYSSADLTVSGNRYTRDSRWRALLRLHAGWIQNLKK